MILSKNLLLKFLTKKRKRDSGGGDVTEAEFEKKRKRQGRTAWASKVNIDFIVDELRGKNFRSYFCVPERVGDPVFFEFGEVVFGVVLLDFFNERAILTDFLVFS